MSDTIRVDLDAMTEKMYGITLSQAVNDNICVDCKQDTSELDGIDRKEFLITGLCPACFDRLTDFEEDDNE